MILPLARNSLKPETKISLKEDLTYQLYSSQRIDKKFKINIDQISYTKIFNKFKKKIRSGETYQIKICTKYKNKSSINPLDFFCRLTKSNLAPEAFMIKDNKTNLVVLQNGSNLGQPFFSPPSTAQQTANVSTQAMNTPDALSYYQSLLHQGYDQKTANETTKIYYPDWKHGE